MVSEPTLAVSRHIRAEVRGHEHGRVGAQMPRHVDGRVRGTDVAQGPLALDARTSHMGRWHWMYGTWLREDVPGLGLTDEDVSLLKG